MNYETCTLPIQNSEARATILLSDFNRLSQYKYWLQGNGKGSIVRYTGSDSTKIVTSLAQDVMNTRLMYDHKDTDCLNNIPNNLRPCTYQQNAFNRNKRKGTSSQYKGVAWNKAQQAWHAYICVNYNVMHLGYHKEEKDAAIAYNNAAILFHKDFAKLNII